MAGGGTLDTDASKQDLQPVPIWRCKSKECKAWIRDELASTASPDCPICKGHMSRSMKHLPKLVKKHKAPPKPKNENPWQ